MAAVLVPSPNSPLRVDNVTTGETIHQRCLIIYGQCSPSEQKDDFLSISTSDQSGEAAFPEQTWPVAQGHFKALLVLSSGTNHVTLKHCHADKVIASTSLVLNYLPLLEVPPLHLAIMVAKDSPLLIDCPPFKRGGVSSAHASLEAAIAKLRMTAYMWQAFTAEDLRAQGLGRRSFRLDEEWNLDTLSQGFLQAKHEGTSYGSAMRSTAKVHIVKSSKTVAELRHPHVAQQNHNSRRSDDLHKWFTEALNEYGGPFNSSTLPVVAGLILDSHYSVRQNLILGHAALGASNTDGISLGMFGSHLTYSWPRFVEEIPSCLLDTANPGNAVGNDNGECGTMWEACSIGQGAFMHEVGHAFGRSHTTGIMARGYAQDWPKAFLPRTSYCSHFDSEGISPLTSESIHGATWDLEDALSFTVLPHFRLPSDQRLAPKDVAASPSVSVFDHDEEELRLAIAHPAGIVRIAFEDVNEASPSVSSPTQLAYYTLKYLETRFDRAKPLKMMVIARNGKERTVVDVWKVFANTSFVSIPGSTIRLHKRAIQSVATEADNDKLGPAWEWAVLLQKKGAGGKLMRASSIDLRIGCVLDGAVVYFEGGEKVPCGPRWNKSGQPHTFGGHQSKKFTLPADVDITKVEVGHRGNVMYGLRMQLSNGNEYGTLNRQNVDILEPEPGYKIIGFYGKSYWDTMFSAIKEFGIITAPINVELPMNVYDLTELQNIDGGHENPKCTHGNIEADDDDDDEDEDDDENMDDGC